VRFLPFAGELLDQLISQQNVLISHEGRALITGLDSSSESQGSELSSVRYSAPEILGEDDVQPTMASDMWSLGCVIYEVFSLLFPRYAC
jgi:serine/threonine protein kinase